MSQIEEIEFSEYEEPPLGEITTIDCFSYKMTLFGGLGLGFCCFN